MAGYIGPVERTSGTSAADTQQTVSSPSGQRRKLEYVVVNYSAAPTHSGIQVVLNSGLGAAFDTVLDESADNVQDYLYLPSRPIPLDQDDVIDVVAPGGGGVITSSVVIVTSGLYE